jgi:hypothetical protein
MPKAAVKAPSKRARLSFAPFSFLLEHLLPVNPKVKSVYGSEMICEGDKMIFFLVKKEKKSETSGVGIVTRNEHHSSLVRQFPSAETFPEESTSTEINEWLFIPADAPDFQTSLITACELVVEGDSRLGRFPENHVRTSAEAASRKTRAKKRRSY